MAARIRRRNGEAFCTITYKGHFLIPSVVLNHPDFISLSGPAIKLLIDVGAQYNGNNNGDLCCARSIMKSRGWNSNAQLSKAIKELISKGWLLVSRQGGLGIGPSLYAITWQPIHECRGKHDLKPTKTAPRHFNL